MVFFELCGQYHTVPRNPPIFCHGTTWLENIFLPELSIIEFIQKGNVSFEYLRLPSQGDTTVRGKGVSIVEYIKPGTQATVSGAGSYGILDKQLLLQRCIFLLEWQESPFEEEHLLSCLYIIGIPMSCKGGGFSHAIELGGSHQVLHPKTEREASWSSLPSVLTVW